MNTFSSTARKKNTQITNFCKHEYKRYECGVGCKIWHVSESNCMCEYFSNCSRFSWQQDPRQITINGGLQGIKRKTHIHLYAIKRQPTCIKLTHLFQLMQMGL